MTPHVKEFEENFPVPHNGRARSEIILSVLVAQICLFILTWFWPELLSGYKIDCLKGGDSWQHGDWFLVSLWQTKHICQSGVIILVVMSGLQIPEQVLPVGVDSTHYIGGMVLELYGEDWWVVAVALVQLMSCSKHGDIHQSMLACMLTWKQQSWSMYIQNAVLEPLHATLRLWTNH